MTTQERARFEVLLENIQTSVNVIAEGHVALNRRFDGFEIRFDRLEAQVGLLDVRVGVLGMKVEALETKVDNLETKVDNLATDTTTRLERIENHLGLNGAGRRRPGPTRKTRPR